MGELLASLFQNADTEQIALKVVFYFVCIDIILIGLIAFLLIKGREFTPEFNDVLSSSRRRTKKAGAKFSAEDAMFWRRWVEIMQRGNLQPPQSLSFAVIEADVLVDDVLKSMGLAGEHMADRLEQLLENDLVSLENLWKAHRMRNNLVHTPGFILSRHEAEQTLEYYKEFLKEVNVLKS